jgi:hypothetical protein
MHHYTRPCRDPLPDPPPDGWRELPPPDKVAALIGVGLFIGEIAALLEISRNDVQREFFAYLLEASDLVDKPSCIFWPNCQA